VSFHNLVQTNLSTSLEFSGAKANTKLHGDDHNVLPHLSRRHLFEALERVHPAEIETILQQHVIPIVWSPGLVRYASCGQAGIDFAEQNNLELVAQVRLSDFHAVVRFAWGKRILQKATLRLSQRLPEFSAKKRVTFNQAAVLIGVLVAIALAFTFLPFAVSWSIASILIGLFFFSVIMLRLFCVVSGRTKKSATVARLTDDELPIYSVLVPLFKEVSVLDQLLWALNRLDYPDDKLDIKIIVEESDTTMRRALQQYILPAQFEIIVVPRGRPQTKPRALNYALQFARGTLLTIFDAEDIPDPRQLRDAAGCFLNSRDENMACVQAQLVFFNSQENWLTRQFTAEYATLFGIVLPALAAHGMPLPLGGTSNHFRTDVLRWIGGWDPFNVTEDADLGLRLARWGYTTGMVDSFTQEEANPQSINWIKQRARWLKGFLQTWLVHMRRPLRVVKQIRPAGFWVLQACTLGVFISALFYPFLLTLTVCLFWIYPPFSQDSSVWVTLVSAMNVLFFVFGYGVSMIAAHRALRLLGLRNWWGTIITMPIYWFLMSTAAWLALYQFLVSPFEWNKTEHGLSKIGNRL
jgi:glycosyltransferase XagB